MTARNGQDRQDGRYFDLPLPSLMIIGGWVADAADRVLPLFESRAPGDARPRRAILAIRQFAVDGKRTAELRRLATAANTAAREVGDAAAAAAARAAGLAAASAYTHPLRDVEQTKHIVGAAAYAALALELAGAADANVAEAELRRTIALAPDAVCTVLGQMHPRAPGASRLAHLLHACDAGLRARR